MTPAILAAEFHPPSTKDFVFDCYYSVDLFGIEICFNFIIALVVASVLIYVLLFLFAFRKARTVPGKLQSLMELGVEFVREQIAMPMLGPAADRFLPLLVTFFFFIFFMNMFEVAPWVNFSASSRISTTRSAIVAGTNAAMKASGENQVSRSSSNRATVNVARRTT